jgi:hypothetical protein
MIIISLGGLLSCDSNTSSAFKADFYDYKKKAVRVMMRDSSGNDFEEMHDTVIMRLENVKTEDGKDFLIEIDESPIRSEFTTPGKYKIEIRKAILNNYPNNHFIYSSELTFLK